MFIRSTFCCKDSDFFISQAKSFGQNAKTKHTHPPQKLSFFIFLSHREKALPLPPIWKGKILR
jgi:hypothetical protein